MLWNAFTNGTDIMIILFRQFEKSIIILQEYRIYAIEYITKGLEEYQRINRIFFKKNYIHFLKQPSQYNHNFQCWKMLQRLTFL